GLSYLLSGWSITRDPTGIHYGFTHGFWLMDFLVEESVELIGATLMAAAAAAFYADIEHSLER
ncbi:hypothetical protein KZO25_17250, partial [Halomonas sp. ANAO-440]|uniref:hypothetical protein n=1 Tax=Halomonas sp. ANAO-440 TaxID=2861360 RepID=UPI001CAA7475